MADLESKFRDDIEYVGLNPTVPKKAFVKSSALYRKERENWQKPVLGEHDISEPTERDGLIEAARCLKCADAPCQKSCPCQIDLKQFMYAVSKQDYYAAAKIMYSDNPMALTCGYLCAASTLCMGGCNMNSVKDGAINIPMLQRVACEQFHRMKISQVRDPALIPLEKLPASYKAPIAILGAGPAGLSCAAYLARLGYQKITIHEKEAYAGGIIAREIPEFRIPYEAMHMDIDQILSMDGIEIKYNSKVESVKKLAEKSEAVFLGMGLPEPISLPIFKNAPDNVKTARQFLTEVALAQKPLTQGTAELPKMSGHCIILGGGDVAMDAASAALKCGAEYVSVVYRENWADMPTHWEELVVGIKEKLDFVSNAVPAEMIKEGDKCVGVAFKLVPWNKKSNMFVENQIIKMKAANVIVAFGAKPGIASYLEPVKPNKFGRIDVDDFNMTNVPGIFAGGDCQTGSVTIVEAVADGKNAAWGIHKFIQGKKVAESPELPRFYTEVDRVDISVDVLGMHFVNPFGLSSASPVTSVGMIKRSFDAGFGFAVTKTMLIDQDVSTNISPRIARSTSDLRYGPNQVGFVNIELLTEKTPNYWVEGIKSMKREYPDRIIICSVMAKFDKGDWQAIAKIGESSGADALELNVSCPHVGKEGMGASAGQDPEAVKTITSWVKEVVKIPVFTKLTPNVTNIAFMGEKAVEGGADGLSAINTVSGIVSIRRDGVMWPHVGKERKTAYGGVSGNMIRPIGLKAVSSIRAQKSTKDTVILGIGGIDSAESAVQFILGGADVVQMTSSIQNQDYTIVDEMVNGLKAHLYFQSREDLKPLASQYMKKETTPGALKQPFVTVKQETGRAVDRISTVPYLALNEQVVAQVDDNLCIKCGKCYMSCNDTGYQAIKLNPLTHLPDITEKCMGCGLCGSVCPTACISYVSKTIPHKPDRGIPNPNVKLPFDE